MENETKNTPKRDGLSKSLKTFFGVGDFAFMAMSNVEVNFFNFFLTNVAKFSLPIVTMITTVTSVANLATSWIQGVIMNMIKPMKWGRYRSFLLIAPLFVPFLYALEFLVIGTAPATYIIIIISLILAHFVWSFAFNANMTMIKVASRNDEEKMKLTGNRSIYQSLAKIAFGYIGPPLIALFTSMLGVEYAYASTAFTLAVIMLAAYFIHFKMFEGYEPCGEEEIEKWKAERAAEKEAKRLAKEQKKAGLGTAVLKNPNLIFLMLADSSRQLYSFTTSGIAIYYFTYVAKDVALFATYLLIANLMGVIAGFIATKIVKKIPLRTATIMTYCLLAVSLCAGYLVWSKPYAVIICLAVAQFSYQLIASCNVTLYANCSIYSEWKTGVDATGTIMGLQGLPLNAGIVAKSLIINSVLALIGFSASIDAATCSVAIMKGIALGFTIIPGAFVLLGILFMVFGYKITDEVLAKCNKEIAERKAAANNQ